MIKVFLLCTNIILAGLSSVLMLSCAGHHGIPSGSVPAEERAGARINIGSLENQIHALINKERERRGLSPLSWNNALSKIARKHSRDMANRHFFDHQSPEGYNFSDRYKNGGYSCSIPGEKDTYYTGAENIFQNNLYDRVVYVNGVARHDWNTLKKIAETTVQGWMNSSGHRKNILTPHWRSEGIGVSISDDDKVYITQNFC
jgi:uncharacterized protein YkwD